LTLYKNQLEKQIVVITGGPGTGKTTIINKLIEKGYTCYPEISRQITLDAKKNGIEQLFLEKPLLFSELLLEGRVKQIQDAKNEDTKLVFLDRGIPDILAYMHFIGDSYPIAFDESCKNYLYSKVFLLPPWEAIYESDEARYENFEQAKLIYGHLKETYQKYNYNIIEVEKGTVEERILFILNEINNGL
jgi:predicted ATPase